MFGKLRRKFIFLILIVSGAILVSFFLVMTLVNYGQIINTNYNILKTICSSENPDIFFERNYNSGSRNKLPYFTSSVVKIRAVYNGDSLDVEIKNEFMLKMSDEIIADIASDAMIREVTHGYISKYNVRYYKITENEPASAVIAICSCDMESHYILKMMGISWISLVLGLLIILIVSILVSKSLIKPAETAWKQQQQFIADASHELKTPLSVIIANNNILLNHKDEKIEDKMQWINSTKLEAEQMNELLNNMMFLTKSDANLIKNDKAVIDFSQLVLFSILPFDSVAFEKKIVIETDVTEDIKIKANEQEMKNVVSIIVDNAVKYSYPNNSISVSLKIVKNRVEFKVKNYGDVIDEREIPLIFERFYRGDKSRSKVIAGYGLGLSIANNIVMASGGTIKCESTAENGTIFTVTLPRAE